AALVVIVHPQRWRAASKTLAPLFTGISPKFDRFIEADGFTRAFLGYYTDAAVPKMELSGIDEQRPLVAGLFEPQSNEAVSAARLPVPSFELFARTGIPGIRHRLLLPATDPAALVASLDKLFNALGLEAAGGEGQFPIYPLDASSGFVAVIPPTGKAPRPVVRLEFLSGDHLPYPDRKSRLAAWRSLLAESPPGFQAPLTPALLRALAGNDLALVHFRPWLLGQLAAQVGAGAVFQALAAVDASYRAALLAQGLSEVSLSSLLLIPIGAEIDDLTLALDVDAGLRLALVASLTEQGARVLAAGRQAAAQPQVPVPGDYLLTAWWRFDGNAALGQAQVPEDFTGIKKLDQFMRSFQECGWFCYLHFMTRAPFGLAKTMAGLVPAKVLGQLPRSLALVIEGVDLSGGYPLHFTTAIDFPREADTSAMKRFLQPRLRQASIAIEPGRDSQLLRVSLGSDPKKVLQSPPAPAAADILGEMEMRLDLLARNLPATAGPLVKVLGRLGRLRARSQIKGRVLSGELLVEVQGSPAPVFAAAPAGTPAWESPGLAAARLPESRCLRRATGTMRRGLAALAMADPAHRKELAAQLVQELDEPLACALQSPATRTAAAAMKEALAGWCNELQKQQAPQPPPPPPPAALARVDDQQGTAAGNVIGSKLPNTRGTPRGRLSRGDVQKVIRRNNARLRFCYEKELVKNPKLAGTVKVNFLIDTNGKVLRARVKSSTTGNTGLDACVLAAVRGFVFPRPQGGPVEVNYPFEFKSE
ncbi:MAG: hypothetical protein DRI34_13370, partial [Deltaproteobacteria bacterium]